MIRASSTSTLKIHKSIKVVIIGDGAVGKTALLISYTTKNFPDEYVPTVFDNYSCIEMYEQKPVSMVLWDTAGQEDYDKLRPLSYPQTDVFLLCYSIISKNSFLNVKNKWVKEISPFGSPFILIGTKQDLRNDKKTLQDLANPPITSQEGAALATEVGAAAWFECSAKNGSGIIEIFQETIRQACAKSIKGKATLRKLTERGASTKSKDKDKEEKNAKEKEEKERKDKEDKEKEKKDKDDKEKEKEVKVLTEKEKEDIKDREREKKEKKERKEKEKEKERERKRERELLKAKSKEEKATTPPSSPPKINWHFFKKYVSPAK